MVAETQERNVFGLDGCADLADGSVEEATVWFDRQEDKGQLRFWVANLLPGEQVLLCAWHSEFQQQPFFRAVLITALSRLAMWELASQIIEDSKSLTFNDLRRSDWREFFGIGKSDAPANYGQLKKAADKAVYKLCCLVQQQLDHDVLESAKVIWANVD